MPNERLRAALLEHGLTPSELADRVGVDHKTVERWVAGRAPYRRHRYMVAGILRKDEEYLWPGALSREQVTAASDSELLAIYPHRSDVPRDTWEQLFKSAEREIGVLVYAGLFLSEDAVLQRVLADRCSAVSMTGRATRWRSGSAMRWRCSSRCEFSTAPSSASTSPLSLHDALTA